MCQRWSSLRKNNHCRHELGKRSDTDKGVNLLSQVAPHEYFTDLYIAKGKAAAGSGSSECIGFPLAWRQLPLKSDWGKCPPSLVLPACSNFRIAKLCRWGGSPGKGVLSKRHSPQLPRQAPASPSPHEQILVPSPVPDATG